MCFGCCGWGFEKLLQYVLWTWNCWIENQILLSPDETLLHLYFPFHIYDRFLGLNCWMLKNKRNSNPVSYTFFCHVCEHSYSVKRENTLAVLFFLWTPLCNWIKYRKRLHSAQKLRVWFIAPWSTLKRWRQVSLALWLSGFIFWYIAYYSRVVCVCVCEREKKRV